MKLKISPKFWVILVGIVLAVIELLSIFAQPIQQALYTKQGRTSLPQTNIIDYRMDPQLEQLLIQNGVTLINFEYNLKCANCVSQKSSLEYYAYQYQAPSSNTVAQIYLEEILDNSLNESQTTISSTYGTTTLTNFNDTALFSTLCKLMTSPPTKCALVPT